MRDLGRPVCIHARLEDGGLLTVVSHFQFTGDQDHTLRGGMPVMGNGKIRRHFEEDI
jgi:hypothetical protein